ncbi:MAG: hypothetical protein K0B00_05985 [Rhodobacteraceae bacterium]|nr:hypothetical protein [Paracoccaceae bacterium]
MRFDLWLAFAGTFALLCLLPGPSVLMVLGQAFGRGLPAALRAILGDVAGGLVMMSLAFFAQFIDPARPFVPQAALLMFSASLITASVLFGYALLAARALQALGGARARRRLGYCGGGLFLGGAALMARAQP